MRRIRSLLPVLCLASFAAWFPAIGDVVVPSERCRGLWIVPLTCDDGRVTLDLVFDTGASHTSIDPDALERVLDRRVRAGKRTTLKGGRIGPLNVRKLRATSHEMDHLARALGRPFDGILGFDTFHDLLVTLDYPASEIRVRRGRLDASADGHVILQDLGKRRPWVALSIGDTRVPILVDSGYTGGLTLREDDVERWQVPPRPVAGAVRYREIVVKPAGRAAVDARFGPFEIERPVVDLSDGTRLLGAESLAGLALTFDQRSKRIALRAASAGPIRHEPMRGLGVVFRPKADGFELARVFDGMAADRAGLREGDVIVAYDGVGVHEAGCEATAARYERERLELRVLRDGAPLDVDVAVDVLVP